MVDVRKKMINKQEINKR